MSIFDELLQSNARYAAGFKLGHLPVPPARRLAVLACMDARLHVEEMLGLGAGDAHIIRNAGGIATADALRSLIISHHLLGTQAIVVINHTDCGMLTFRDDDLAEKLEKATGAAPVEPSRFYSFGDLEENLRRQLLRIRTHPWIPKQIPVRGFVYDVRTGRLKEVSAGA